MEAIRRMKRLKAQGDGGSGNNQTPEQRNAQERAKRRMEQLRQLKITRILTSEAKKRLDQIALVHPNKARAVENVILKRAQMGLILTKVSDEKLISLLEKMDHITTTETKVTADPELEAIRRRMQELMVQRGGGSVSDEKPISLPEKMDYIATT